MVAETNPDMVVGKVDTTQGRCEKYLLGGVAI